MSNKLPSASTDERRRYSPPASVPKTIALLATLFATGCGPRPEQYQAIHQSARTALPIAVEMEQLFGTADHFITHFGSRSEASNLWNTVAFFGGRYELTMQVKIRVDYDKNQIEVVGDPEFYLVEVRSIKVYDDGRTDGQYDRNFRFTKEEWKTVSEHKGDFSVIGFELKTEPVAGFDAYVASWRKPRIPMSLLSND